MHADESAAAGPSSGVTDEVDEVELARVMRTVPIGAGVLAGLAVALLVLGYLLIYTLTH
jgi:hypothetical protein